MAKNKHIVIYRLSAMGDVAMMVQSVRNVLENNPNVRITLVTRPFFHVFFGRHENLSFFPLDLASRHKGFVGLLRLSKDLLSMEIDTFFDLHDVLRSKIIRSRLSLSGVNCQVFDKGRKDKLAMLNGKSEFKQLAHSVERYNSILKNSELNINDDFRFRLPVTENKFELNNTKKKIGFAPFSAHNSKEWGLENVKDLLSIFQSAGDFEVLLFGGGNKEETAIKALTSEYSCVKSVAGEFSMEEELSIMNKCDLFIAMDSSNMHLADLVGCKTISIWICTHPYFGFFAWSNRENSIHLNPDKSNSIPLSIFGKLASENQHQEVEKIRNQISPSDVFKKIKDLLD